MAVKNRVEAIAQVNTKIVPIVTNTIHKDLLNNDILNSTVFRKDVINSTTASGGLATCNFSNTDLITLSLSDSVNISFTGLENGDVKYLYVTKPVAKSVTFSAATEVTPFIKNITDLKTSVLYQIFSKNGLIFIKAIVDTLPEAVASDILAANAYKITTGKAVFDYVATIEAEIVAYVDSEISDLNALKITKLPVEPFTVSEIKFGATVSALTGKKNIIGNTVTISTIFTLSYSGAMADPIFELNFSATGSNTLFLSGAYVTTPALLSVVNENPLRLQFYGTVPNGAAVKFWGVLPLI